MLRPVWGLGSPPRLTDLDSFGRRWLLPDVAPNSVDFLDRHGRWREDQSTPPSGLDLLPLLRVFDKCLRSRLVRACHPNNAWSPTQLMSHGNITSHTHVWPPVPAWPLLIQTPAGFHLQGRGPCPRRSPTARCEVPDRRSGVMVGLTLECPSHQSLPPNHRHTLILLYPPNIKASSPKPGNLSLSLSLSGE